MVKRSPYLMWAAI